MIRILYFSWVREGLGVGEDSAEPAPGLTVAGLLDSLETRGPAYREALRHRERLRFALNQAIVQADTLVNDGDEVAVFPPVTGG